MVNNDRTRMSLWSSYRDEIYKFETFTTIAKNKNEKFDVLFNRLLKVFPAYERTFPNKKTVEKKILDPKSEPRKVELFELHEVMAEIELVEKHIDGNKITFTNLEFNSSDERVNDIVDSLNSKNKNEISWEEVTSTLVLNEKGLGETKMKIKKINVAIDGPSGSGKSTVAQMVAKKYGMHYINSGSIYRTIALYAYENNIDVEQGCEDIAKHFHLIDIKLEGDEVYLNGREVSHDLRRDIISGNASKVAAITLVREFTKKILDHYIEGKGIVMDGRDITSKIMPDAEVRVYLDTSPEVRAKRRYEQNIKMGFDANFDSILKEIEERDFRDKNREKDPLIVADGVSYIDSSDMNIAQVANVINLLVEEKNKK